MEHPETQGLVCLNKSPGRGSASAVAAVKAILKREVGFSAESGLARPPGWGRRGPKVGHAGTLDPFAAGVLVVLVGRATRLCEAVMSMPKGYDATVKLGATTATLDPTSEEIARAASPLSEPPPRAAVEAALAPLVGDVLQVPPVFSALKVGGRRASDRARAGEAVSPEPRRVRIDRIDVLAYDWPAVRLRVECGRGTYVRAVARDLGDALGVGGYLTALTRTRVGPFTLDRAVTLDDLDRDGVRRHLIDPAEVGEI